MIPITSALSSQRDGAQTERYRARPQHAVVIIRVEQEHPADPAKGRLAKKKFNSKVNLVDLAGSERASKTGATGETLTKAPLTGKACVDLIITDLAVLACDKPGLRLIELAPGITEIPSPVDPSLQSSRSGRSEQPSCIPLRTSEGSSSGGIIGRHSILARAGDAAGGGGACDAHVPRPAIAARRSHRRGW